MSSIKTQLRAMIRESFGKDPLESNLHYNATKRMDKVRRLHDALLDKSTIQAADWEVDDITWNDLEMDQVFLRINHTGSFIGEQTLYHELHQLRFHNGTKAQTFEKSIDYLQNNSKRREGMEARLYRIGKRDDAFFLPEFLLNSSLWKVGRPMLFVMLQLLLIIAIVCAIVFYNPFTILVAVLIALTNLMIYIITRNKYSAYMGSLANFKYLYDFARWIVRTEPEDSPLVDDETRQSLFRLRRVSYVVHGLENRVQSSMIGDAVAIFREYLWGILLIDVMLFNWMMRVIEDRQDDVLQILKTVGELDSYIAVLSYRESIENWCIPAFAEDSQHIENFIEGYDISHPLIHNPVPNDFVLKGRAMITGTNASGKSTFMKAVAINCLLAQTIHTCYARQMTLTPLRIVTCMALRDDVVSGESYYYRETKYLKRILDLIVEKKEVLVVIDEILKGTNTKERIAASQAILDYIAKNPCLTIVATHDNGLTNRKEYRDYHFRSSIQNNDIIFDYRIHEGVCEQSNAIELLSFLDYPKCIIEQARKNI